MGRRPQTGGEATFNQLPLGRAVPERDHLVRVLAGELEGLPDLNNFPRDARRCVG